jgi:aminoglycoside phosphotransferase (APT) family kinase protein
VDGSSWYAFVMTTDPDRDAGMHQLVARVNRQAGLDLRYSGAADLGETAGAAFVEWPDGRRSVVTVATVSAAAMWLAAGVLELARGRGVPVPRHERVVELEDATVAVVQERLPGRHAILVDADLIDTLVAANDRFAGLLVDRPDVPVPAMYLTAGGPVFPRHETLEQYSDRSRRLLRRIQAVGTGWPNEMTGDDLLHPDLTVPNILLGDDGQVTGIVDWNGGVARGDRRFALVKLLFDLTWDSSAPHGGRHRIQATALDRLDAILHATIDEDVLRMYWAHWTLTMLHWTIGSGESEVIDLHLRLGERGLG